jgi:hypothetical protein
MTSPRFTADATRVPRAREDAPPEAIRDPAITIERASSLLGNLGFIAFQTPPDVPLPDSCVTAVLRSAPTLRHFDPESVSYWVTDEGRGALDVVHWDTQTPGSRAFSWGRIRLVDRFGIRNSFVSFGGRVDGERMGPGELLLIFRSPAPILRLRSHSQRPDDGAEEVVAFFGRTVPRLWASPDLERLVNECEPTDLYSAFLLHCAHRLSDSRLLREAMSHEVRARRELDLLAQHRPDAVARGRELLEKLGLEG